MRKERILVVDDDPDIREVLELVLGAEGLDVATAFDGMTRSRHCGAILRSRWSCSTS